MSISANSVLRPARMLAATSVACLFLSACAYERPQSTFTPGLDTGITSSDGGGARALGNQPNVTIGTQVGPR